MTDVRFWLSRVNHKRYRQKGVELAKPNYYVQIHCEGKRRRFYPETPNKAAGAVRARDIYSTNIISNGFMIAVCKFWRISLVEG